MPRRIYDAPMVARTHRLRADQWAEMAEIARAEGISEADLVREIADLGLLEYQRRARRRRPGAAGTAGSAA